MSSTNKLLQTLSEDPQLEKQIGCMAGILQLFDRHQVLTGRRLYGHKRISGLKPPTSTASNCSIPVPDRANGVPNESKVQNAVEDQKQKLSSAVASRSSSPEHQQNQQPLYPAPCANTNPGSSDYARPSPSRGALDASLQSSRDHVPNLSYETPHSSLLIPRKLDSSRSLHEARINISYESKVSARRSVDTAERAAAAARGALKELSKISTGYMVASQAEHGSVRDMVRSSFSQEQQASRPSSTSHKSGLPRDMSTAQYRVVQSSMECTTPTNQMQVSNPYMSQAYAKGRPVSGSEVVVTPLLPKSDIPAKTCADINESLKLLAKLREATPPYSTILNDDAAESSANHIPSARSSAGLGREAPSFQSGNSLPRNSDRVLGRVSSYEPGRASSADILPQGGYKARETPRLSLDGRGTGAQPKSDSQVAYHQKSYARSYVTASSRSVSCSNSDCDTESLHAEKRNSFSSNVVAKLMGLDEMPNSNPPQAYDKLHAKLDFSAPNSELKLSKGLKYNANPTFSQCGKYVSASFFPSKRRDDIKINMHPEHEEEAEEEEGEEEEEEEGEAYLRMRSFSQQEIRGNSNIRAGYVKLQAGDRLVRMQNVNHEAHPCYQPKNHHLVEDRPPHILSPAAKLCAQIEEMQRADSLQKEADKCIRTTDVHQSLMQDLEELRQLLGAIRVQKDHINTGSHVRMLDTRSTCVESVPQAELQPLPSDINWNTNEDLEAHSLNSQRILLESQNRRQRGFNGSAYSASPNASSLPASRQYPVPKYSQVSTTKVNSRSTTPMTDYPSVDSSLKRVNAGNACTSLGGMRRSATQSHTPPPSTATRISPALRVHSNQHLRQGSNRSCSLEIFSVASRSLGNLSENSYPPANKQNKVSDEKVSKSPGAMAKSKEQSKANLGSLRHRLSAPTERRYNALRTGASTTPRIGQQKSTENTSSNRNRATKPLARNAKEVKRKLNFSDVAHNDRKMLTDASEDQNDPFVDKAIVSSNDRGEIKKSHPALSDCGDGEVMDGERVNLDGSPADYWNSSLKDVPSAGLIDTNTELGATNVISSPAPIDNYQGDRIKHEIPHDVVTPNIRRNLAELQLLGGGDMSMTPPTYTLAGVLKLPQTKQEQENEDTESQGEKSTGSCEQPSPISVLDGPFYEDDRPSPSTTSKFVLKLQELEEAAGGKDIANDREAATDTGCHPGLVDCRWSQPDTTVINSQQRWTTDLDYVKQLLQIYPHDHQVISGAEQVVWKLRQLQPHEFLELEPRDEVVISSQPVCADKESKMGTWHHRLLFDAVNGSIERRLLMWLLCQCQPWLLVNKHDLRDVTHCSLALQRCIVGLDEQNNLCFSREAGKVLLEEIWEEIAAHLEQRSKRKGKLYRQSILGQEGSMRACMQEERDETDEDSCDRVGYLLEEDIMGGPFQCSSFAEEQAGLHVEKGEICLDLERLIFKDLIDSTIRDLGIVLHPFTTTTTKRQLSVSNR